jgi:hypothetical protein
MMRHVDGSRINGNLGRAAPCDLSYRKTDRSWAGWIARPRSPCYAEEALGPSTPIL